MLACVGDSLVVVSFLRATPVGAGECRWSSCCLHPSTSAACDAVSFRAKSQRQAPNPEPETPQVKARIAAREEAIERVQDSTNKLNEEAAALQKKLDDLNEAGDELQRRCDVLQGKTIDARNQIMSLTDLEEDEINIDDE